MKFKKILTVLLLLMTITLCSCDFSNLNEPTNNEIGDVSTPEEQKPTEDNQDSSSSESNSSTEIKPDGTDNNPKTEESNNTSNEENSNDSKDDNTTNETLNQEQNKEQISSLTVPYPNYSNDKNFTNEYFEDLIIEVAEYVVTTSVMIHVEVNGGYSLGSGVIYQTKDDLYYVLTNDHVVEGGLTYTITTNDNKEHEAKLLGTSSNYDVAVLSFETTESYNVISFEENEPKIASYVIAVGTPLKETYINSTTIGNVSKLLDGQILHTASINSGNSGGGLFNTKGNLIGLNNSKLSGETSSGASIDNMFFAISKDYIIKALKEMNSPKLGITTVDVKNVRLISNCSNFYEAYYTYGVSEDTYNQYITYSKYLPSNVNEGLLIVDVAKDSNAYNHLEIGDVLVTVDSIKIDSVTNIKEILASKKINDSIKFEIYRNKELKTVEFKLLK